MTARVVAVAIAVIAIAAVVAGLRTIGSPREARRRQLDARRVENLTTIQQGVDAYVHEHHRLPASLDDALTPRAPSLALADPVTGARYEYAPGAGFSYQLCAVFDTVSPSASGERTFWQHGAGRRCFSLEAAH